MPPDVLELGAPREWKPSEAYDRYHDLGIEYYLDPSDLDRLNRIQYHLSTSRVGHLYVRGSVLAEMATHLPVGAEEAALDFIDEAERSWSRAAYLSFNSAPNSAGKRKNRVDGFRSEMALASVPLRRASILHAPTFALEQGQYYQALGLAANKVLSELQDGHSQELEGTVQEITMLALVARAGYFDGNSAIAWLTPPRREHWGRRIGLSQSTDIDIEDPTTGYIDRVQAKNQLRESDFNTYDLAKIKLVSGRAINNWRSEKPQFPVTQEIIAEAFGSDFDSEVIVASTHKLFWTIDHQDELRESERVLAYAS